MPWLNSLVSRNVRDVIFVVLLPQKLLLDSDMGTEELINPPAPSGSVCGSEDNELHNSNPEPGEADSSSSNSEVKEDKLNIESLMQNKVDFEKVDSRLTPGVVLDKDLVDKQLTSQGSVEVTETIVVTKLINSSSSGVPTENGCLTAPDEGPIGNHMIDGTSISGVKRARLTIDEQQPSVHVIYNSLTRDSKRKLEELLQQWSEWHAKYVSSSHDPKGQLDSGEKTYFPALHVGLNKSSAVSFWVDNQTRKQQDKEFISLDGDSVPLYDRGFALGLVSEDGQSKPEGALEIIDASRCFNCGSYNHSMKECPKPRDNVAVNNARKQHKSRRNQNPGSRNPTRYYQNSPGGRYDGLRPGALGVETRELLGLGELDPPPWLNRMREMGYPPGYLDPEEEEQPSGITIYADEEVKDEQEDGEILETEYLEPQRKMSVEFPGINAPIPKNADERRWAAGSRPHRRLNHSYEPSSRRNSHEQRWSRDYRDDGPCDSDMEISPPRSSYPPRHGGIDSSYTSYSTRGNIPRPRSPNFGRSLSDRGGRSSLVHEDSLGYNSYSSLSYSSSSSRLSPHNYGSASYENNIDDRWNGSSSWSNKDRHRHDEHRYHKGVYVQKLDMYIDEIRLVGERCTLLVQ
uniref:CCHC-type domain-containing protein n=1 Tax=Vitis vinifera TaxID=29760 RepID=F6GVR1_VITVI